MRPLDLSRRRTLVHRRRTAVWLTQNFPTLEWMTIGRSYGIPHDFVIFLIVAAIIGLLLHRSVFGTTCSPSAERRGGALLRAWDQKIIVAAGYLRHARRHFIGIFVTVYTRSISPASHGSFYELYGSMRRRFSAVVSAWRRGLDPRRAVLGAILLRILQNLVDLLGVSSSLIFGCMGTVDLDWRAR